MSIEPVSGQILDDHASNDSNGRLVSLFSFYQKKITESLWLSPWLNRKINFVITKIPDPEDPDLEIIKQDLGGAVSRAIKELRIFFTAARRVNLQDDFEIDSHVIESMDIHCFFAFQSYFGGILQDKDMDFEEKRRFFNDPQNAQVFENMLQEFYMEVDHPPLIPSELRLFTSLKKITIYPRVMDVSILQYLENLESVFISGSFVTDISFASKLHNLQKLQIGSSMIKNIFPLKDLVNLKVLHLQRSQIEDISSLENLCLLEELFLEGNKIREVASLTGLVALQKLSLDGNEISETGPLKNLVNLKVLSLNRNRISDISFVQFLPKIVSFYVQENPLTKRHVREVLGPSLGPLSEEDILKGVFCWFRGEPMFWPVESTNLTLEEI